MIEFKNDKDRMLFTLLHPILIMITCDLYLYAKDKHKVHLVITDTISTPDEDASLGRVSTSHQKGLALDIRTKDLSPFVVSDIVNYINSKWIYKSYHYLSNGGKKRLAYFHIGNEQHIHLAIHQKYQDPIIQNNISKFIQ